MRYTMRAARNGERLRFLQKFGNCRERSKSEGIRHTVVGDRQFGPSEVWAPSEKLWMKQHAMHQKALR
ncbi:hypothetical protein [Glutamicibacter sp. AOP3-A1-12]|uniref:hypothetical protein n=1 Tax=Glutamicibacter sp. AOP3-A1-12 TaxID=3457701 RepID=UPI0040341032